MRSRIFAFAKSLRSFDSSVPLMMKSSSNDRKPTSTSCMPSHLATPLNRPLRYTVKRKPLGFTYGARIRV
ncbi:MAG: hypothetical protein DMF91_07830 [Acidobacteria bacterium]|nr:MAG: hypothetical protein DMF91_07830 [Acidobacteriota bacterium]